MDISQYILDQPHAKQVVYDVVTYIDQDPNRLDELMQGFLHGSYRLTQRAAWSVREMGDQEPKLMAPYIPEMIAMLRKPGIHDAVPRNILALFSQWNIPEDYWGELWDICFEYLNNVQVAVAIRVHAMTVLGNIAQKYPELAHELKMVIEEHMPSGSRGFQGRGKRILKALG